MSAPENTTIAYAIRDVAESLYRRGNLGTSQRSMISGRDGQKAHKKWQKSRPGNWTFEKAVSETFRLSDGINLKLAGRADGFNMGEQGPIVEEVKTVRPSLMQTLSHAEPHHLAQCKIYAALLKPDRPVELRVTYIDVDTGTQESFTHIATPEELKAFLNQTLDHLQARITEQQNWMHQRAESVTSLAFPYDEIRPGQDQFMDRVAHSIQEQSTALLEAPTGIGKTVGALYPALRHWAERPATLFYLTAKNTGKQLAEQALDDLRTNGAQVRSITLTAKAAFTCEPGIACDPHCPGAIGFFDRLEDALKEMRAGEQAWTPECIRAMAKKHTLCPFEFSLFLSEWADVIICDYNYVFDPRARLRRFFDKPRDEYLFLIDEAHNLPERGRDMLSATLDRSFLRAAARDLKQAAPQLQRALSRLGREFSNLSTSGESPTAFEELPPSLPKKVKTCIDHCEAVLLQETPAGPEDLLLELYFNLLEFQSAADSYAETHRLIYEKEARQERIRIFCLDPSQHLAEGLAQARAAIGFSATLMPPKYYTRMLGLDEEQPIYRFASPFPPEHLDIEIETGIRTTYQHRDQAIAPLVQRLAEFLDVHPGNYLVFFPSYAFMEAVRQAYQHVLPPLATLLVQAPGMSENERRDFLNAFQEPHPVLQVGFAVMGGIFGEGIDLGGEQLTGALIVGAGLPQVSFERQLIRDYFDRHGGKGFDMAYTWPGWTRVAQAAGRIIRSESDRGRLLLVDHRFAWPLYRELFPPHWRL